MAALIGVRGFGYSYPRREEKVLRDLSFSVEEGEFLAIMGRNGAGKSTLCQALNGVIPHLRGGTVWGEIRIDGLDTRDTPVSELTRRVGIVLEDPEAQLFTTRVDDEVAFGLENLRYPPEEIERRITWASRIVRIEDLWEREPASLSGGQKQRCAIAAALAMQPRIMVLDEPTSQLDPVGTDEVFSVVRSLSRELGMTVLFATHKSEHIAEFADRVLVLDRGGILALDTPRAVFRDAPLLAQAGIRPPAVSSLHTYLDGRGARMGAGPFPIRLEEARERIRRRLREAGA